MFVSTYEAKLLFYDVNFYICRILSIGFKMGFKSVFLVDLLLIELNFIKYMIEIDLKCLQY